MSLPILPISTGLITASLATIFTLASVKPAQAHHSVTIDGTTYACGSKSNECDLSGNALTILPTDVFSGLTNLQKIYLDHNNLSSVSAGLFRSLTNLKEISLNNNSLSSVPPELFGGLPNLQVIRINHNNLSSVPRGLFSAVGLSSLQRIHLHNNILSSIPADLLSNLPNLQEIALSNNNLSSVPESLFNGLSSLQRIYLHNNSLTSVPEDLFSDLTSVSIINLSHNSLSSVPATLLLKNGLSNAWVIDLSSNSLSCKPGISPTTSLELDNNNLPICRPCSVEDTSCSLASKNLDYVPAGLFSGLTNLQTINLSYNNLNSVPADLFRGLSNLQVINMSRNSLSSVPEDLFSNLINLQRIDLHNNNLSSVSANLFNGLSNLLYIILSYNNLSSIPVDLFNGLSNLQVVSFINNPMFCHSISLPGVIIYWTACTSSGAGARSSQINVSPSDDQFISIPLDQDGTSQITINLSDYFDHLFDDNLISPYIDTEELTMNLTYIASSSNEEAVTVSIADSSLTVTPIKPGTSIVTVSFTGTGQLPGIVRSLSHESLARTFNVVVYSTEATVPMNLIPDQNITTPMTINLSDYFNGFLDHRLTSMNPDSMAASLIYTVNSSNRTAVTVSIDDSLLTLTPVGSGTSTVTVNLTSTGQLPAAYPIVSRRSIARAFDVTANVSDTVDSNLGITEINKQVLPSILDKVTSRQVAAITDRLDSISSASYPLTESSMDAISMENVVTDVAHYLAGRHQQLHTGTFHWDWKQALSGRNFSFPLPGANLSQATTPLEQATATSLFSNPSLWGSVDYYSIEDRVDTMTLDGDLLSFYLGMDVQPRHDMVTGMLVNVNQFGSALQHIDGLRQGDHYDVHLTTFSPYFSWFASDHLSLWASAAYGRGEAVLSNSSLNTSTDGHTSKGAFSGFSLGGRLLLAQRNNSSFALLFDGSTSSFLDVDLQRARLAAQASRSFYLNSGGSIDTSLDLALLMGSAAASVAELAGSFSWTPSAQSDLTASFSGRTLLFGGQQRGWGIDADIYFSPGEDDEGFSISVAPSLGITTPQFAGLHSIDSLLTSDMDFTNQLPEAHLNAEMAYGLRTTNALFTPYSNVSFSPSTSSYSAGLRYDMATKLEIDLRATHQRRSSGYHNAVLLQLSTDL